MIQQPNYQSETVIYFRHSPSPQPTKDFKSHAINKFAAEMLQLAATASLQPLYTHTHTTTTLPPLMASSSSKVMDLLPLLVLLVAVAEGAHHQQQQQLVPAVMIFGDSVVDVGNNNNNPFSLVKANFLPYGRDFAGHSPTGRFCNGKLATDYTVENLGFSSYPMAYLDPKATGKNLLIGANFASGASGFLDATATLYNAVSLPRQLEFYKEYQSKVANITGKKRASKIFQDAIYLVSAGNSDYIQNYYINPIIAGAYTPPQFADLLIQSFSSFIQKLHGMGGRRIGATTLPPLGCLPAAITMFGATGSTDCVARLNTDAVAFNAKMVSAAKGLEKKLPGLKLVVLDIYNPLHSIITNPSPNGFFETRRSCCGTGTIETSLLCNAGSPGTCTNATGYVFWDSFHPTEAANRVLAQNLLTQGIELIG